MAKTITSSQVRTDAITLFTSLEDFNTWQGGLSVASATESAEGVVSKGVAVANVSGSSAANAITTIDALLASLRTAGVITTP
tara:strand:+ start:1857 stop:2102 length:246 start_codon:yes stop_codon:yes gene_type:complete